MSRDIRFLLLVMAGVCAAIVGVALLCLLPGYMMDSGSRACLRWLRSPTNQANLRQCAEILVKEFPEGSAAFDMGFIPKDRTPHLVRQIPPPASGWFIKVVPSKDDPTGGHVVLVSLGGFGSGSVIVGTTNLVIEGIQKVAPGIYVHSSG